MLKPDRQTPTTFHAKASALATAPTLKHNGAALVAAWCALYARSEGREADYRFWFTVFESHLPPT